MAIIRRTMENIRRMKPRINRAKITATTEADIRRHMREDGDNERDFTDFAPVIPSRVLRKKLHMTQTEFARALRIPLATLRNWEQGRVLPDPAARSLLTIVARNPRAALRALGRAFTTTASVHTRFESVIRCPTSKSRHSQE